jgi:hypothetical protein
MIRFWHVAAHQRTHLKLLFVKLLQEHLGHDLVQALRHHSNLVFNAPRQLPLEHQPAVYYSAWQFAQIFVPITNQNILISQKGDNILQLMRYHILCAHGKTPVNKIKASARRKTVKL